MTQLAPIDHQIKTMTSLEISELVNSRHDKVKQSIERLAERGAISLPPLGEVKVERVRRTEVVSVYLVGKRDSYVIVAQLSPEFTARLVDRWQELESAQPAPLNLADPHALRAALLGYAEKVIALEATVAEQAPAVAAQALLAGADGSMCITNAAKALHQRPKDLFAWLSEHRWIYKRAGTAVWLGYQDKIQSGHVEHKTTTVERSDGTEKVIEQVLITAKGLDRLARAFAVEVAA